MPLCLVSVGECHSILQTKWWSNFDQDVTTFLSLLDQAIDQNEKNAFKAKKAVRKAQ
jgi:hypothetical protein